MSEPTRNRNANRLSLIVLLGLAIVSLLWVGAAFYAARHSGSVGAPTAVRHSLHLHLLKYLWLLSVVVVMLLRPEFRKAVWGREDDLDLAASTQAKPEPEGWGKRAIVFLLYAVLAFVFTLPNSIHPSQALLGRGGDNYLHAWFLWEFARALAHGQNPFHTNLILYPIGANLTWATTDILGQIIAVPFSLLLGPIITYNLSLVLQLALGAFFARMLCLRVSGSAVAATIGGIVFGFSPFLLAHALGHLSLITTFPLPIYVLALGRLLDKEKPSWKDGVLLGLALALVALGNYEYALIFVLFSLLILAVDLGRAGFPLLKRVWMPLATSAVIFFLCLAPILLMMLKDYAVTKPAPFENATAYSADALSFFVPSLGQSLLGGYVRKLPAHFFVGPGGIEGVEFIGLAALFFALIGCWAARGYQRRWAGRALVAGVVFALLSLGPTIHVLGKAALLLPAPAAPFYKLSVMRFLREPARLSIATTLCVSLLASIGLTFVLGKLNILWKRSVFACAVGAIVVLEYLVFPFPSSSVVEPNHSWVPPTTAQRCTLPPSIRDGTVLTIPLDDSWHFNDAMWMQMIDGGRYSLIDGRVSPYIPGKAWDDFVDKTPILAVLNSESQGDRFTRDGSVQSRASASSALPPVSEKLAAEVVKQLDLRAVVVFDAPERPADVNYVRDVFGASEKMVGDCAVFDLAQNQDAARESSPARPKPSTPRR